MGASCACVHVSVCCLFQWRDGCEGELSFLTARERKDVSSLDSGVPLLFVKTKQKEKRTRGERGEKKSMREGKRGGRDRGRERESKKLEPVTDNNAVCSLTET